MKRLTHADAPTLDALAQLLNEEADRILAARRSGDAAAARLGQMVDLFHLPTYGGSPLPVLSGAYSWDPDRRLIRRMGVFAVVSRAGPH